MLNGEDVFGSIKAALTNHFICFTHMGMSLSQTFSGMTRCAVARLRIRFVAFAAWGRGVNPASRSRLMSDKRW